MPKINWTWLAIGAALGYIVLPMATSAMRAKKD